MARAQAQYLRIYDTGGTTYQRWQSYYANTSVTWASAQWIYVPFIADGIVAGLNGDESDVVISAPATGLVVEAFENAIRQGHLAELTTYQFDAIVDNNTPQASQVLVANHIGQVTGGSATLTTLRLQVGAALAPIGTQIPPRVFTTAIMGQGIRE